MVLKEGGKTGDTERITCNNQEFMQVENLSTLEVKQ
jgi:hypothetical protein